ncbi:MAG: formylmethanofuran--tetrahydromethanopterin N-formyltransferase [Candidatus Lokiarchaeota archaeon]|nr:formylmethanofuran--tetrahydromethanopterin N-formyltransferase [Candidatus Lokiarchaeota archaeon]
MELNGVKIDDTYAEAFDMWCTRVLITAINEEWAMTCAQVFSGFAVSAIACDCEAGIDEIVPASATPDGRPGVSVMLYSGRAQLGTSMLNRMGQCILTCPTASAFDWMGLEPDMYQAKQKDGTKVPKKAIFITGRNLAYFGDGFEEEYELKGKRMWKIPVMEGWFNVEHGFNAKKGIAGGNLFIFGDNLDNTLKAAVDAVKEIKAVKGVIASFPGGVCRSGSKTGSLKYKFLNASTNHLECPVLKEKVEGSKVPAGSNCVLELVFNGLNEDLLKKATAKGIKAAVKVPGIIKISAGNFGGTLGKVQIHLKEALGL